jgi:BlaI family transcriptional regulator, penicillinase repressor
MSGCALLLNSGVCWKIRVTRKEPSTSQRKYVKRTASQRLTRPHSYNGRQIVFGSGRSTQAAVGIGDLDGYSYVWDANKKIYKDVDTAFDYYKIKSKEPNVRPGGFYMARPPAKELTERELEVMQIFWKQGGGTTAEIRDELAAAGQDLAYTTVATLIRILTEKSFVKQTTKERPFVFRPIRSYEEVSGRMLDDLVDRVFQGSREELLVRLVDQKKKLSAKERALLTQILKEHKS